MANYATFADFSIRVQNLIEHPVVDTSLTDSEQTAQEAFATEAITDAHNLIVRKLKARGFTGDQIDLWDERKAVELDQAIYIYGNRMGWKKELEPSEDWLERFNWESKLETLDLVIDGTIITADSMDAVFGAIDLQQVNEDLEETSYSYGY